LPFFWFPTLIESIDLIESEIQIEVTCNKTPELERILTIIDSLFYCFTPFFITLLFSALTVKAIIRVKKTIDTKKPEGFTSSCITHTTTTKETSLKIKNKKSSSLDCLEPEFLLARYLSKRPSLPVFIDKKFSQYHELLSNKKVCDVKIKQKFSSSNFKITFLILVFPLCFLVTNIPIISLIAFKMFNSILKVERNLLVEFSIAKSLLYLNNSINILLLLCFSKRFRNNFLKTFFNRKTSLSRKSNLEEPLTKSFLKSISKKLKS